MKVQFKYTRKIGKALYRPGIHQVDDKLKVDWFFDALVKCGEVKILDIEPAQEDQSSNQVAPSDPTPKTDPESGQPDGEAELPAQPPQKAIKPNKVKKDK